jgi:hypothetical protein
VGQGTHPNDQSGETLAVMTGLLAGLFVVQVGANAWFCPHKLKPVSFFAALTLHCRIFAI